MKTLLILRHAKSSWKDDELPDHERPLNKRGQAEAPQVGQFLREHTLVPDLILCSTARRARTTADLVVEACGYKGELILLRELYAAPPEAYLKALSALDGEFPTVMVVGHNPGLEELVQQLTGEYRPMPTSGLAQVQLLIEQWGEASRPAGGKLVITWRPKQA